jgi:hypothetical protein
MQYSKFLDIFNPKADLHAGLSLDGDVYRYVLVSRRAGKPNRILVKKAGPATSMRIPFNGPVHTDMGSAPVLMVHENIGDADPEQWVDKNEARIIPTGVSSGEINNEWTVFKGMLYSATVSKKVFEQVLENLKAEKILFASLSVPLWNLARLYSQNAKVGNTLNTFIIWKFFKGSSVLGLVEGGRLWKLCNFWAGIDDVHSNPEEVGKELAGFVKAMSQDSTNVPVICLSVSASLDTSAVAAASGCSITPPPQVPGIPVEFHEAYALACHQDTQLDFTPFTHVQDSHILTMMRRRTLKLTLAFCCLLAIVAVGLFGIKAGALSMGWYLDKKAGPSREYMQQYKVETGRLALLQTSLDQKNRFLNQRSLLTYPVTELQIAFPEDAWASDISFSETKTGSWNCSITAYAFSSSLIPVLLKNLSSIAGMSNVRMVYSEQTGAKGRTGERAIKLQIECSWKGR